MNFEQDINKFNTILKQKKQEAEKLKEDRIRIETQLSQLQESKSNLESRITDLGLTPETLEDEITKSISSLNVLLSKLDNLFNGESEESKDPLEDLTSDIEPENTEDYAF